MSSGSGRPGSAALIMATAMPVKAEVRGHGEVDRARQDDRHLAERQDDQDRGVVEDGGEVARPREAGEAGRDQRDHRGDGDDQPDLAVLDERSHAAIPAAVWTSVSASSFLLS